MKRTSTPLSTKVPRPMNCFLTYRLEKQSEIVKQCPGANHRDISKIIAKWWKEMTPDQKEPYRQRAEMAKQQHKKLHPEYKFQPKKKLAKPRPYKKRSENEFTARDFENKHQLLTLYNEGKSLDASHSSESLGYSMRSSPEYDSSLQQQHKSSERIVRSNYTPSPSPTPVYEIHSGNSNINNKVGGYNSQILYSTPSTEYYVTSPTTSPYSVPSHYSPTLQYDSSAVAAASAAVAVAELNEPFVNYNLYSSGSHYDLQYEENSKLPLGDPYYEHSITTTTTTSRAASVPYDQRDFKALQSNMLYLNHPQNFHSLSKASSSYDLGYSAHQHPLLAKPYYYQS